MSAEPGHGLLPLVLLAGTLLLAYVKISVALAVLRRGLGGDVLPRSLGALLALLLSGLAMAPLAERCHRAMQAVPAAPTETVLAAGAAPLADYLRTRTPAGEQAAMKELRQRLAARTPPRPAAAPTTTPTTAPTTAAPDAGGPAVFSELAVLVPAFVLAELRVAFQLGFLLLLPFLLIDLLCASLLSGLLLPGLSPRAVALPFKLLVFVLADGWRLLVRGLLWGYA
ncbi:MAG: EscR/YscR/HrcR family type III secretion system export apparatus protein [Polyangia bacterium]